MSHVTDTFLFATLGFDPDKKYPSKSLDIEKNIQAWVKDNCNQQFKRLDNNPEAYGGSKALQCTVYASAFNYVDVQGLVRMLRRQDWDDDTIVSLLIQDEHDHGFTLIPIKASGDEERAWANL